MSDLPTDLYRFFAVDGRLLYVGISLCAITRSEQHRCDKVWWNEIQRMEIEKYPNRTEALEAEQKVIETENPVYNVAGVKAKTPVNLKRKLARQLLLRMAQLLMEGRGCADVARVLNSEGFVRATNGGPWTGPTVAAKATAAMHFYRDNPPTRGDALRNYMSKI